MKSDYNDPTIVPQSSLDGLSTTRDPLNAPWQTSLCDAVANGRVFIMNGRGEMEQVRQMTYWHTDTESIRTVVSEGYEIDEDGETIRDWRPVTNRV